MPPLAENEHGGTRNIVEAILLGLLGLLAGAALSPLASTLSAWPEGERPDRTPSRPPVGHGEAGFARPLALVLETPRQATALALATGGVFAAAALRYEDA